MSGFDDLVEQGKKLYDEHKDEIGDALKSEQAEGISDSVLDGVADFAKKVLPDEQDGMIDDARKNVDGAIGNQ